MRFLVWISLLFSYTADGYIDWLKHQHFQVIFLCFLEDFRFCMWIISEKFFTSRPILSILLSWGLAQIKLFLGPFFYRSSSYFYRVSPRNWSWKLMLLFSLCLDLYELGSISFCGLLRSFVHDLFALTCLAFDILFLFVLFNVHMEIQD